RIAPRAVLFVHLVTPVGNINLASQTPITQNLLLVLKLLGPGRYRLGSHADTGTGSVTGNCSSVDDLASATLSRQVS
ncbi:MAG TPA: hypothetical protein VD772_11145, partial [Anseongella sp.]|nr:hypothetical protein [Anseongella sp.]